LKLPRDWSGDELVRRLARVGYGVTRQTGSHVRLTRPATEETIEHHATVPRHDSLRIGTLADILDDIAAHLGVTRDELLARIA
jgi:predicted RNA binding protein YcfA (HicA-like mRNA interferase family)